MKKAVIIGCAGQDGRLLWDVLAGEGCALVGIDAKRTRAAGCRFRGRVRGERPAEVDRLIRRVRPHEVYYLAAFQRSSEGEDPDAKALFRASYDVNLLGLLHFLEAIRMS